MLRILSSVSSRLRESTVALVTHIGRLEKERQAIHRPTECSASAFRANGRAYLQLDTFGSATRKQPGKTSQSLQFTEESAAELKRLIEEVFPQLR